MIIFVHNILECDRCSAAHSCHREAFRNNLRNIGRVKVVDAMELTETKIMILIDTRNTRDTKTVHYHTSSIPKEVDIVRKPPAVIP